MTAHDVSDVQVTRGNWGSDDPGVARWERACLLTDLFPERGAAALFGDVQVALFRLPDDTAYGGHAGRVYAVQNLDPFSAANVVSRGIVGTRAGEPTVAAPVYKQVFSLVTGTCLVLADKTPKDDLPADLVTYPVEVREGVIYVGLT
ncbi:nitrite reductase small subunit NirD [Promicromonospora kroppenstedtii]|uniref:nitrite reductase small subunit NirD n=1 Tax=Promicromonospora kroppenstedtii TaxID=440482 RepID=UPI0004B97632|nr:nitrite reductase small subunit NirD [Promicromonospora kroppenstedtii]